MKPPGPLAFWTFLSIVLVSCAATPEGRTASTAPQAAPSAASIPPARSPFTGLTPCAKDAPEGEGCATKSAPATSKARDKKVDDTVWRVPVGRDDPAKGARDAPVTLVVFSDFQCPFCRNGAAVLEALLAEYPAEARLVWKDLPLPMHAQAEPAAEFARAVRARLGDDGFWRAHALLYESQATLGDATYRDIAKKVGLPWEDARAAMRGARYGSIIQASVLLSDRVDVPATPTTFVNGRKIVGSQPYAVFKGVVDEELEKAKALLSRGISPADLYATIVKDGKELAAADTDMSASGP